MRLPPLRWLASAFVLTALFLAIPAALAATNERELLSDPAKEERARGLTKQLRCLVCQNQSIDDSDAELAQDLRRIVREEVQAGKSDDEILSSLVERYGDFVLLKPPVRPTTWGLWFGPFVLVAIGALGVVAFVRTRARNPDSAPAPLSAEEAAELERLRRAEEAGS